MASPKGSMKGGKTNKGFMGGGKSGGFVTTPQQLTSKKGFKGKGY